MKLSLFTELQARRAEKTPVAMVTDLQSGTQALITRDSEMGDLRISAERVEEVRTAIEQDQSGRLGTTDFFVHVHNPPLRMIVVGAVHIAQSLVPMAQLAGYEVVVVDPRQAWASDQRFPGVRLLLDWPDDALALLKPDRRTAIVTLTHDPKLDDPALQAALQSDAFYIGSLGSKRTHAKRLGRLAEAGIRPQGLARIHGPIGLPLGSKSPAEIAIAILAQIIQVRHDRPAASPADRKAGAAA